MPEKAEDGELVKVSLDLAEKHGVLQWVGSTFSLENNAVYDGLSRDGVRLVSMAPILKHDMFPLAEILKELLAVGATGTSSPVEIEFAVNLDTPSGRTQGIRLSPTPTLVVQPRVGRHRDGGGLQVGADL